MKCVILIDNKPIGFTTTMEGAQKKIIALGEEVERTHKTEKPHKIYHREMPPTGDVVEVWAVKPGYVWNGVKRLVSTIRYVNLNSLTPIKIDREVNEHDTVTFIPTLSTISEPIDYSTPPPESEDPPRDEPLPSTSAEHLPPVDGGSLPSTSAEHLDGGSLPSSTIRSETTLRVEGETPQHSDEESEHSERSEPLERSECGEPPERIDSCTIEVSEVSEASDMTQILEEMRLGTRLKRLIWGQHPMLITFV